MKLPENTIIQVEQASLAEAYKLRVSFSDGTARTVDFGPFLEHSRNPLIRAFLQPDKFAGFDVRDGDLMWGDYELVFPVANLYEGTI